MKCENPECNNGKVFIVMSGKTIDCPKCKNVKLPAVSTTDTGTGKEKDSVCDLTICPPSDCLEDCPHHPKRHKPDSNSDEIREAFEKSYTISDQLKKRSDSHYINSTTATAYYDFFKGYTVATQKAQEEIDSYKIIFDDCKSDDIPGIVTTKMLGLYLNIYDTIKVDSDRVSDMVIAYKVSAESYQSRIKELEQQIEDMKNDT